MMRCFAELPNSDEFFHKDGALKQNKAGEFLGVDQSVLSRWFKKKVGPPPKRVVESMVEKFSISAAVARGESEDAQHELEFSTTARGVAKRWDTLPVAAQAFLSEQIDQLDAFRDQYPEIYKAMFGLVDSESYRRWEAQMEAAVRTRKKKAKNPSKK